MRRLLGTGLIALAVGCGGDSGSPNPPPPPPPPPGPPASLTVQQGNNQSGEPGQPLPVHPSVIVKDASGRPVPNATVTFAVDSGGGNIASGSPTSGTDGVATAGAWTLGGAEGRNILIVSASGVPSVKLAATAVIPPTDLVNQTVPASGGSVVVSRPGSPVDGLRIDVPVGAFTAPVQFQLSYASSASLPHVKDVTVASPIVTITSDMADAPAKLLSIRIPATIGEDEFPMVALVDPATGFLDGLPTVSYDGTGVTASFSLLDETLLHTEPAAASFFRPSAAAAKGIRARVAVFLAKASLLHLLPYDTQFRPGVDDWEFQADGTPVFSNTEAGQIVLERFYFTTRKSQTSGSLWNKFVQAEGVPASDVAGHQWAAAVAKQFDSLVKPHIAAAVAGRAANPVAYDRSTIQWIVMSFIASAGAPQIVAFGNPATGIFNTVLAFSWGGPTGSLDAADPEHPGQSTQTIWTSNGLNCSGDCVAVVGVNHLIGYQTQLDAEYGQAVAGTIDRGMFPKAFVSSGSSIVADTLFVADDTTRVWVECPTCFGQAPTTVVRKTDAVGLQSQQIYVEGSGGWSHVPGSNTADGFLLDLTKLPTPNGTHFADFRLGIEGRSWMTAATGGAAATGWLGWKQYQVTRYALTLSSSQTREDGPVTITLGTEGGPSLPVQAAYVFDWGDGTTDRTTSRVPSNDHEYQSPGSYQVVVEIHHLPGDEVIARATKEVQVGSNIVWRLTQFSAPLSGFFNFLYDSQVNAPDVDGIKNTDHATWWKADSTFLARLIVHPETGILVYLRDSVQAGNQWYRPGLYLQSDPTGTAGRPASFDPTQQIIFLARVSGPPYPDVYSPPNRPEPYVDTLTVTAESIKGSAIVQIRDFTGLPSSQLPPQRKRVLLAYDVDALLAGSQISGSGKRYAEPWVYLPASSAHGMWNYGHLEFPFSFAGVRVQ